MAQKSKKSFQNRVLIQTLSRLSHSDLKTFRAFCNQSPTISEKTKTLFEFLCKAYPNFEKLTEEKMLSKFFPDNPKAKIQLNYAFHDLSTQLRKWMIQKELDVDDYLQRRLLIRACKKQFLHQQFFKNTRQTLDALEDDFLEVPNTWLMRYETNYKLFYHVQTPKNQQEVESLTDMEANLELFYFGSKIRLLCQKIIRKQVFKSLPEIDASELELTLNFAQKYQDVIPFFSLYLQIIHHLKKPEKSALNHFIRNFKRDRTKLDRLDQSILFYIAANSLNNLTMTGDKTTLKTQFDLFQYAFDNDLVLFDNEIGSGPFNGFLVAACMLGEFKVAQKMLKKYKPFFNPKIKEDFANLMQCTIYFHQKKYEKIELSLNQFSFKIPGLRIRSRHLLLRSLYERYLKDKTLKATILSELVKLRKYIQKQNVLSESRKITYYTLIVIVRKLTNAAHKRPSHRAKVKHELTIFLNDESNKPISRDWLLEKIDSL